MGLRHLDRPTSGRSHPWEPDAGPTLVVVPHPDDESLSTGGLIVRQHSRARVDVLAVTDGDAAPLDRPGLAALRRREQRAALDELGDGIVVHRLHLPDGQLARYEDQLTDAVSDLLPRFDLVVAPWTFDHHTDHEACGRATARALSRLAAPPTLMFGLFWAWHQPDTDLPLLHRLDLTADERRAKERAIRRHRSQLAAEHGGPIVSPVDLVPALWPSEYYVEHVGAAP